MELAIEDLSALWRVPGGWSRYYPVKGCLTNARCYRSLSYERFCPVSIQYVRLVNRFLSGSLIGDNFRHSRVDCARAYCFAAPNAYERVCSLKNMPTADTRSLRASLFQDRYYRRTALRFGIFQQSYPVQFYGVAWLTFGMFG